MKRTIVYLVMVMTLTLTLPSISWSQAPAPNIANVTFLKTKWPDKGTMSARDSLVAIYNANVTNKNDKILSHREYYHYFTGSSSDYMIVEEYKDLAGMEAAFKMNDELEKKAWPDEMKRKAFMDTMGTYFENWHGDNLYHINAKLSKN